MSGHGNVSSNLRLNVWYGLLVLICVAFIARLFYLQVIKHDFYRTQALSDQLKEYVIPAERGIIEAYQGDKAVPLVLNEKLYTLFGDPGLISDVKLAAAKTADITAAKPADYEVLMKKRDTRYVVLTKRLSESQKDKIVALKLPGVGVQAEHYRTYPQGSLAAQILGFVNSEGKGNYGIEQALDYDFAGQPGRLKAITDANGVPLVASKENTQIDPVPGKKVRLTIDLAMQKELESILAKGLSRANSKAGSALIMDPYSGAIKAMANFPTYNPAEYFKVSDQNIFANPAVGSALEIGSSMKVLTAAAALDLGVIKEDTSYYDPNRWTLNGHPVTNIREISGPGQRNIADILNLSLNTGATWMLMQMGGGEINKQARERWHNYMTEHYRLGKPTGIEQGYEAAGYIPPPNSGFALDLAYANTSFGQAMTLTPLQMAAALSSIVNGGTYWQPRLIDATYNAKGDKVPKTPKIVRKNVVSAQTSQALRRLMEYVVTNHNFSPKLNPNYGIGGKTGTPQIANPAGGYYEDRFNGTYIGFVGGDVPKYVIAIVVREPRIGTYAGAGAAQPIFGDLARMLISNFNVPPKNSP